MNIGFHWGKILPDEHKTLFLLKSKPSVGNDYKCHHFGKYYVILMVQVKEHG